MSNAKFFNSKSIAVASFLGGTLGAGLLIAHNFNYSGRRLASQLTLLATLVLTAGLIYGLISVPEDSIVYGGLKFLPILLTGICVGLNEWVMMSITKNEGVTYHRIWPSIGAGIGGLVVTLGIVFGFAYYNGDTVMVWDDQVADEYNEKLENFSMLELEALEVFQGIEFKDDQQVLDEMRESMTIWQQIKTLVESMKSMEGLPQELTDQNNLFSRYTDLRIIEGELIIKTLEESTDKYNLSIEQIRQQIDEVLALLVQE